MKDANWMNCLLILWMITVRVFEIYFISWSKHTSWSGIVIMHSPDTWIESNSRHFKTEKPQPQHFPLGWSHVSGTLYIVSERISVWNNLGNPSITMETGSVRVTIVAITRHGVILSKYGLEMLVKAIVMCQCSPLGWL